MICVHSWATSPITHAIGSMPGFVHVDLVCRHCKTTMCSTAPTTPETRRALNEIVEADELVEAFSRIDVLVPYYDVDVEAWAWRCIACTGISPTRAAEFHTPGCTWRRAVNRSVR